MSKLLTILFLLISISGFGKCKPLYIEINTGLHARQNKKLQIFHSRKKLERFDEKSESFEVNKAKIIIDCYDYDTLILKSEGYIPIVIGGLYALSSDTIRISNLTWTKYNPVDSFFLTHSVFKKRKKKYVKTDRESRPDNFTKFKWTNSSIQINEKKYDIEIDSNKYETITDYILSHQPSFTTHIMGVRILYLIHIETAAKRD